MSRKTNRLKLRVGMLQDMLTVARLSAKRRQELTSENDSLRQQVADLKQQLARHEAADRELAGFLVNVKKLPWSSGRYGPRGIGDVYAVQVDFCPEEIALAFSMEARGDPWNVSRRVHYLAQELAQRVERVLHEAVAGKVRA